MNKTKDNGLKFLEFISTKEEDTYNYQQVAGSFAVIKCEEKYLFCYNIWRKQWELPAGRREGDETPKDCAIRELYEETGQIVSNLEFRGLLKTENTMNGEIKFNPVYFTTTEKLQPFKENEETSEIMLWDLKEEIGYIDSVDIRILDFI
ncbi:NUDIX domain-containing protein [Paenisporosarcina sp. TG20]|uniref:NUDIX domain-containing protein n=1 Tax=Paenisporosarcina sp. TG20 TaxID=1211706 RepID=UPI000314B899|nr:NUDIX domain-containing protein [Paenisporosarcina sp. TG20]